MIRLTNSAESYDVRHEIENIKVPVMIVGAEEDYLTPLVHQRILNNNLPNSRLVILPGVGHASMYEVPEVFTTILIGFLKTKLEFTI
ncbi:alpha/beta fold hydrolase [Acholeplasma laidlawii]|uniref:alpha/beta fold hydrolase n=1 Tax=Acholeplasma laidlawii TaxID=2148 RepID=UPI002540EB64|nr:alpha/beta hydrolase [Acholeplasma laidlawii]